MGAPHTRRRPAPSFHPRATLGLLYVFFFFFLYCIVLALPDVVEAARSLPPQPVPDEAQRSAEVWRQSLRGKVPFAFVAAVVTTGLGIYARVLPGVR
jgi:hypothetical protein